MANVGADGSRQWAGHIRLSLRASWHNTTKPTGSGDKVNTAFVHGKFTSLSGEIWARCGRGATNKDRRRPTRLTKDQAYSFAVDGDESRREPRNRQRFMIDPAALYGNVRGKRSEVSRRHSTLSLSKGKARTQK